MHIMMFSFSEHSRLGSLNQSIEQAFDDKVRHIGGCRG